MARRRRRASLVFVIHVDSNGCRVQCCELSEARCGRRHGACHQGRRRSPAYRPEGRQGALRVRFISYGCCFGYSMLCFGYPSCVLVCLCCLTGVTGRRTIARHRRCNDSAGWTVRGRVRSCRYPVLHICYLLLNVTYDLCYCYRHRRCLSDALDACNRARVLAPTQKEILALLDEIQAVRKVEKEKYGAVCSSDCMVPLLVIVFVFAPSVCVEVLLLWVLLRDGRADLVVVTERDCARWRRSAWLPWDVPLAQPQSQPPFQPLHRRVARVAKGLTSPRRI